MFTLGPKQCLWAVLTWVDTVSLLQGHHMGEMLTSEAGKPRLRGCHKGVEWLSMPSSVIRFGPAGKMGCNMDAPCGIDWESLITGSSRHPWTSLVLFLNSTLLGTVLLPPTPRMVPSETGQNPPSLPVSGA